jgi:hypothetical protein
MVKLKSAWANAITTSNVHAGLTSGHHQQCVLKAMPAASGQLAEAMPAASGQLADATHASSQRPAC